MPATSLDTVRVAAIAKALAHPVRVQIVELLAGQSECRGAEVFGELPLAQSTVSEHLRVLREAGVLSASHVGTSSVYCLHPETIVAFATDLSSLADMARACQKGECGR